MGLDSEGIMLDLVDSAKEVRRNISEYQKAVVAGVVVPSQNKAWYWDPKTDKAGGSRFVGYKKMSPDRYQKHKRNGEPFVRRKHPDGGETERNFAKYVGNWVVRLQPGTPDYRKAERCVAQLLNRPNAAVGARLNKIV